VGMALSADWMR